SGWTVVARRPESERYERQYSHIARPEAASDRLRRRSHEGVYVVPAMTLRSITLALAIAVAASLVVLPSAPTAVAHPGLVRGVAVAGISSQTMDLVRRAGFTHIRATITWRALQSSPRSFEFDKKSDHNDLGNILRTADRSGLRVILRVDGGPPWAGGTASSADSSD